MPNLPQAPSVTIEQTVDIVTGATLEEAGEKMAASLAKFAERGHQIVSVSHAFGPVEGEDKWSIMVFYRGEG